jgi:hypothetical protein
MINCSIYDAMKNKWIITKVQGDAPLPRSNHAATLMDPDLIIIHGGRHGALWLSDTYILQVCYKNNVHGSCFFFTFFIPSQMYYLDLWNSHFSIFRGKIFLLLLG